MRPIDADHLLHEIAELQKSPWYNTGKEIDPNFPHMHIGYLERKEAVEIVRDLCIKQEPTIQPDAPRVLTLEELDDLRGRGRAVWFENRDSSAKSQDVFFVVANDLYADLKGETYSMFEMVNDYRQTWRCWTSRPTDAQREAVKWDED